jgi:Cu-processing system ATP-binding protein
MIRIQGLNKRFGRLTVLSGLDLTIREGGIFAVLGPNGSGKTTLIKCLLGMVIPDQGIIEINDMDILGQTKYRDELDYLPQIARFPGNLKVRELIQMIRDIRSRPANPDALIQLFGLEPALDQKLGVLSGGTKQKVNLVLTFMFDSPLRILDEPTTGLDPVTLVRLKELIAKEKAAGKTLVITSHIMRFVDEIADEIVFLLDGRIYFQGTGAELKRTTGEMDLESAIAKLMLDESGKDN